MIGGARLLSLRLQGFKSFADRTRVDFVPGINAVVGPNGSGKSNLADALRWALGEQGRAIRSRKSEDVVFAGSERRSAVGMADVALTLDNADGLLPLDFAVVELGRRLYRSGENDYLVNRQRVRLRDLVELLDAAHLAENAFLFIGQGMVDQALSLRPEERRPLVEEVAGVRRHERRRRRAEEQLAEAEANLARAEDILAELRPQARRLAAQAEQQASRERAATELAFGLVAAVGARWHDAAGRTLAAERTLAAARAGAASALDRLHQAETAAAAAARTLAGRAEEEAARREELEAARAELATLQLAAARATAQVEAARRDRARIAAEREAAEAELAGRRHEAVQPEPRADVMAESEQTELEAAIAECRAELAALRSAHQARDEVAAAARRAAAAGAGEREAVARRLADVDRRLAGAGAEAARAAELAARAAAAAETARERLVAARGSEDDARAATRAAGEAAAGAEAARAAAAEVAAAVAGRTAGLRGGLEALRSRLAEDEARGIGRAARRAGGTAVAAGLDVEPVLRAAVGGALGELGRAFVVGRADIALLAGERGSVVLADASGPGVAAPPASERAAVRERAAALGGGLLGDAVRVDPTGVVRRLLGRAAWVPGREEAIELAGSLPVGWLVAARDGTVARASGAVRLGGGETVLDRRAEALELEGELAAAEAESAGAKASLEEAAARARAAAAAVERARRAEAAAADERRVAEEADRRLARDAEAAARDAAWSSARLGQLAAERATVAERAAAIAAADVAGRGSGPVEVPGPGETAPGDAATAAWEARLADLLGRRDRLAAARAAAEAERRAADERRARAEAAATLAAERLSRADAEAAGLVLREAAIEAERMAREPLLAVAVRREADGRAALERSLAADAAGRQELRAAEAAAASARDAFSQAEDRLRAAELAELEARLALDAIREQALVEFAGLGDVGLAALQGAAGRPAASRPAAGRPAAAPPPGGAAPSTPGRAGATEGEDEDGLLASALALAGDAWAARPPAAPPPTPGRLVALRRRLHETGAANPFAADEYAALRARLDGLEAQRTDLVAAIERTRALIVELDAMIGRQFRATFAALEAAFDRRFSELFGGGFARLALTEPGDLAATGVEIVARPPGKKAQALSTLSGGERALTAVALLFAMLDVRPVPFCVLDEVDAALDEANIGRFVEALRGLADQTQVIVITHNRGTIEVADALYGVTVDDDAVSRVISLRVEEATALAEKPARDRPGARAARPAPDPGQP